MALDGLAPIFIQIIRSNINLLIHSHLEKISLLAEYVLIFFKRL